MIAQKNVPIMGSVCFTDYIKCMVIIIMSHKITKLIYVPVTRKKGGKRRSIKALAKASRVRLLKFDYLKALL